MRNHVLIGLLIGSLILGGCKVIPDEPTAISVLVVPTLTEAAATKTMPSPTLMPAPTMEPTVALPEPVMAAPEIIDIQSPLPGQQVLTTTMEIRGMADPTFEQNLEIRLVTMDGEELLHTSTIIQADAGQRGSFLKTLEFNSGGAADGMLQVFSRSAKDGSLEHLSSRIVKFGSGTPPPTGTLQPDERIQILNVQVGHLNTRLQLIAEGVATGIFENTLQYKLCGDGGVGTTDFICGGADNVIIASNLTFYAPEMGSPGNFNIQAELPNGKWRDGRVVIYSISPANGEVEHASSMIIRNGP